jgi:hypothetical protein
LAKVQRLVVTERLPVRVEPVQGEAIDSWLAAMARAMDVRIGSIARIFGLPARLHPLWITWLAPDQVDTIGAAAGIPRAVVESMTLSVYDGDALKLDPKTHRLDEDFPYGASCVELPPAFSINSLSGNVKTLSESVKTYDRSLGETSSTGTVWINCHNAFDSALPFGGYQQSGWGRELGEGAINEYTQSKSINIAL